MSFIEKCQECLSIICPRHKGRKGRTSLWDTQCPTSQRYSDKRLILALYKVI